MIRSTDYCSLVRKSEKTKKMDSQPHSPTGAPYVRVELIYSGIYFFFQPSQLCVFTFAPKRETKNAFVLKGAVYEMSEQQYCKMKIIIIAIALKLHVAFVI